MLFNFEKLSQKRSTKSNLFFIFNNEDEILISSKHCYDPLKIDKEIYRRVYNCYIQKMFDSLCD